jgi:hypothetical protein
VSVHTSHLREERLLDCYYTDRRGEDPDLPAVDHLSECSECRSRYDELARMLDGLREEAELDTDKAFTPERLLDQQRHIARRIAQIGRAARIISFPGRFAGSSLTPHASRGATQWIAAAAVAGLLVGVGVGVFYDSELHVLYTTPRAAMGWQSAKAARRGINAGLTANPQRRAPAVTFTSNSSESTDEFLSDLAVAAERPHTRELQAFDAFTPHVREASSLRD